MKAYYFTAILTAFLLIFLNGLQSQTPPTAIKSGMDVKHLHGNPMPEMGQGFDDIKGFKNSQMQEGYENIGNPKTGKVKQFRSEMGVIQLLDSVITEYWDTLTNQWVVYGEREITYDASGNMTRDKGESHHSIKLGFSSYDYIFDTHGNLTSAITSGSYVGTHKIDYTYDVNGYITMNISYFEEWDGQTKRWVIYDKEEYSFDAVGNMTLEIQYTQDEMSQIIGESKNEFTYDANGDMILKISYNWDVVNSQWINSVKDEYSYDTNGNTILIITYNWDGVSSQWIGKNKVESNNNGINGYTTLSFYYQWNGLTNQWDIIRKFEYAYNESKNLTLSSDKRWVPSESKWYGEKEEYIYDGNGNITIQSSYYWDNNKMSWIINSKYEHTYDANGSKSLLIMYSWNLQGEDGKHEYTYDANGNMTLGISYKWETFTSLWVNYYKNEYTYDANGNITNYGVFIWDVTNSQWVVNDKEKREYTYDANGNMTLDISYRLNTFTSQWIANSKTTYYYSAHSITNIPKTPETQLSVFPNPATNKISITTTNESQGETLISIFSINGQLIQSEKFQNTDRFEMDVSAFAKGIYLLRIQSIEGVETQKVVLQ